MSHASHSKRGVALSFDSGLLGTDLPYLGSSMLSKEKRIQARVDYQINRASAVFKAAFLSATVDAPSVNTLFTYWDTYGDNPLLLPDDREYARVFQLIERRITNPLANKRLLARSLVAEQLSDWAPPSYESTTAALQHPGAEQAIWFVKSAVGTGGKGMFCLRDTELALITLEPGQLVQRGVENIRLIDGRKFTVRVYVLVWNGEVYLYDDGFAVIHGVPYEPGSTDYTVQIDHQGYEKASSAVALLPMHRYEEWKRDFPRVGACIAALAPVFQPVVSASSETRYAVLGLDFLFTDEPGVRLIEINNMPNFIHNKDINETVNIPFWRSVVTRLLSGSGAVRSLHRI